MKKRKLFAGLVLLGCIHMGAVAQESATDYPFRNPKLSVKERVDDLIARLTLEEKVKLMKHNAPAIERLGIPAYNWWNEALHGVARTKEKVTVFPQAIGMAATFDTEALRRMGDVTSTEGRALFNEYLKKGGVPQYYGLTYWTPNINIFRDPRWGRGQETYGEDPYLTGQMGMAMVHGLEGNDPHYLKAVACAKHFAVHSGPEGVRHSFDARPALYDLWDTYLPAFRDLVCKAGVHGVMCAYNRVDGQPCCGNDPLLVDILRNQWQFQGYVTSDCWAVSDFASYHKTHPNNIVAASDAMLAGTDLECGDLYQLLAQGVEKGLHSERDINTSLARLFTIQMKLGMYDPQEMVRYPFGYGLSYTTFAYSGLACQPEVTTGQKVEVSVKVKNTGSREGDEVVQLYVAHPQDGQTIRPIRSLKGFRRVHLQAGEEREVRFTLTPEDLALCDRKGNLIQQAGDVSIFVGGGQPGYTEGVSCQLAMKGDAYGCF